jgi:hypothetical protein
MSRRRQRSRTCAHALQNWVPTLRKSDLSLVPIDRTYACHVRLSRRPRASSVACWFDRFIGTAAGTTTAPAREAPGLKHRSCPACCRLAHKSSASGSSRDSSSPSTPTTCQRLAQEGEVWATTLRGSAAPAQTLQPPAAAPDTNLPGRKDRRHEHLGSRRRCGERGASASLRLRLLRRLRKLWERGDESVREV